MDPLVIVAVGLLVIVVALWNDLQKAKTKAAITSRPVVRQRVVLQDPWVYPWWRNYYYPTFGSYVRPYYYY